VIRSAVIGAGRVAQQHLACVASLPQAELVGVCDLSPALAESAAERFGARASFTDPARMLAETRPDVVHITTPVASHFRLAHECLDAGAHVFLEKPATVRLEELVALLSLAEEKRRILVEDYNYLYNEPVRRLRQWVDEGALGEVVHADVLLCLNVLDKDYPAMDANLRSPVLDLPGGVIADFLPHLASLAHAFCGPASTVRTLWDKRNASSPLPYDEFRAVIRGARASASLAFSAHAQPDSFRITVLGTRARATADIFENRATRAWLRPVAKPLVPLLNALDEARATRRSAWKLLWRKLGSGPGSYDGLWFLVRNVYEALAAGKPPPVTPGDMLEVNRLVDELKKDAEKR
jgi:predicted dehydrogenase